MGEYLRKWQILYIDNIKYVVVNMVEYQEDSWIWQEYEIKDEFNECLWLCVEKNEYGQTEYSIYTPYNGIVNTSELLLNIDGKEYELYEKGVATVKNYFGNADVDIRERCHYTDYITKDGMDLISVEFWGTETEKTQGEYIDKSRVVITNETDFQKEAQYRRTGSSGKTPVPIIFICLLLPFIFVVAAPILSGLFVNKSIEKYLDESSAYTYVTSVTNNSNNSKATVYRASFTTLDQTVKNIIDGVPEGITDTIDSDPNTEEDGIGLHTSDEFAYVYLEDGVVYVQISEKEYVNNNSGSTYHKRRHSHYYRTYSSTRKSTTYSSYSYSARQQSINSRRSSGGGTSSGK
ncbi:MAG: DUF4178 domain-containing protein [Ruminococcus sp.]|nr:DUF4178 domain-containing protein [Ruminococcus sp.]